MRSVSSTAGGAGIRHVFSTPTSCPPKDVACSLYLFKKIEKRSMSTNFDAQFFTAPLKPTSEKWSVLNILTALSFSVPFIIDGNLNRTTPLPGSDGSLNGHKAQNICPYPTFFLSWWPNISVPFV